MLQGGRRIPDCPKYLIIAGQNILYEECSRMKKKLHIGKSVFCILLVMMVLFSIPLLHHHVDASDDVEIVKVQAGLNYSLALSKSGYVYFWGSIGGSLSN